MWLCGEHSNDRFWMSKVVVLVLRASLGGGGLIKKFLPSPLLDLLSAPFLPSSLRAPFPPAWSFLSAATLFFGDQCISLSPPARFPPPHKQDLFLIDASCSIKVTTPPHHQHHQWPFTFHFSAPAFHLSPPFLLSIIFQLHVPPRTHLITLIFTSWKSYSRCLARRWRAQTLSV